MIYLRQIEQVIKAYSAKLALKPKKEWTAEELEKLMRQYAEDVEKLVRDATLRFYEANQNKVKVPADLADLPLFRTLPPYNPDIPPLPTGAQPPLQSVKGGA